MSRIIRQLQRDQKQSDPVFTTISRPLSKLPGRHPRELNFTERMCRSWMIGGWWRWWWWWRGRGWLDDTKMEWRDHGGRFRRDEMKLYTDRNNERCSNFPRLFRLEIHVKRDTGGFTCPVVSKNRGPYFQMEITESRKTCKWADTSSELIERFHRHTANPAKGTRERYNTHALRYTRVWKHTHTHTYTYGDVVGEGRGGRGEGGGGGTFAWWTSLSARISSEHRRELIQFERICT